MPEQFHYIITIRPTGEVLLLRATSVEDAAGLAARQLCGRRSLAHRATGTSGGSGVFAAYRWDRRLQASNQIGSEFHVRAQ